MFLFFFFIKYKFCVVGIIKKYSKNNINWNVGTTKECIN